MFCELLAFTLKRLFKYSIKENNLALATSLIIIICICGGTVGVGRVHGPETSACARRWEERER